MHYVYKIINTTNGHFYIGKRKHHDPKNDCYMGSGKLIKQAIKKYGVDKFTKEILAIFETNDEASTFEKSLVTKEMVLVNECYNMHEGGHGGFMHINNSPPSERKNLIALKNKIKNGEISVGGTQNWTEESFAKARKQCRLNNELGLTSGWHHTDEAKQKLSDAMNTESNNMLGNVWCINTNTEERKPFKKDAIPDGWITTTEYKDSKKNKSNPQYGKKWYNDGVNSFMLHPLNEQTNDLLLGRLIK